MQRWLMKSEPSDFCIDDLMKCPKQTEPWDGIRNYQVRNTMRDDMKIGDRAFFYHSSCKEPGIVGIMEIVSQAYPDPTAFDPVHKHFDPKSDPDNPRWLLVDVRFKEKFEKILTLTELRTNKSLAAMRLLQRGCRLSITPVSQREWKAIVQMG